MMPLAAEDGMAGAPQKLQRTDTEADRLRKVVSLEQSDSISPLMLGNSKYVDDFSLDRNTRHYSAKLGKRLSGRFSTSASDSSMTPASLIGPPQSSGGDDSRDNQNSVGTVIEDIEAWLRQEKTRRKERKARREARPQDTGANHDHSLRDLIKSKTHRERRKSNDSSDSGASTALEKLESIIEAASGLRLTEKISSRRSFVGLKRPGSFRKLRHGSTASVSDTELNDEISVPNADAVLDNSKTLSYFGGNSTSSLDLQDTVSAARKDREAWLTFKYEIMRLSHTLKIKGWRHVPMTMSAEIDVERLSGALTNAVYVVSPPSNLLPREGGDSNQYRRPPAKLLLRIYGPKVEHLIDRDAELQILRRLGRKKIGPCLLGTFSNGRFEEYFHSRTLKPLDLRIPETSKQIAKRMRELHDGIELLDEERENGPFVWRNWDKWLDRCEKIVSYTDKQILQGKRKAFTASLADTKQWKFVCGTEWKVFRSTVEKYRKWLDDQYGGAEELGERLIFAHNDTQYGNILRIEPPGKSSLLLPANQHKQLVVIDFEYANANMRGLEFANHFTEWCYNYHDPTHSYACSTERYPTLEEQYRFIRAYVVHQPGCARAASTPKLMPRYATSELSRSPISMASALPPPAQSDRSQSAVSSLSLIGVDKDRYPANASNSNPYFHSNVERPESLVADENETAVNDEIAILMQETKLWRIANSAQWVAWGVMQARVPGLRESTSREEAGVDKNGEDEAQLARRLTPNAATDSLDEEGREMAEDLQDRRPEEGEGEGEEEFDHLSYARDRAMLFWGDCLQLGLVTRDELEKWGLEEEVKIVER